MKRVAAVGVQDFGKLREKNCFYVDKTGFIKEWWESNDDVTLITRPRRFGKTLTMSMLDYFFSVRHAGEGNLFQDLNIWQQEEYHNLQGTYPVISLSFSNAKGDTIEEILENLKLLITELYDKHYFLLKSNLLTQGEQEYFLSVKPDMANSIAAFAIHRLSDFLSRYYGKRVLIFLDEYDTPMQEAYVGGFWKELVSFTRSLFNATFKTNPYMERAILTGITRVSKESIFSDLNNLRVVTTTSSKYADAFGFTEEEVFDAMEEFGLKNRDEVKAWYDGFVFGKIADIYNPWSITHFLDTGELGAYWANTSSNELVSKLIREGNADLKKQFEQLLRGKAIECFMDEEIIYNRLTGNTKAIWSLLLAAGYLKVVRTGNRYGKIPYLLALTNYEVEQMFMDMVSSWFDQTDGHYNQFVEALLCCDLKLMNKFMNEVALSSFSYFDSGNRPSGKEPERFYHGFVLGLLVELSDSYAVESNRESGFGRYDVMITPHERGKKAFILEFKVYDPEEEKTLKDTVAAALAQIEEKHYEQTLLSHGMQKENIRKYGFAFRGSEVLIGEQTVK